VTAEIAIMNKGAVALAADSAVTIQRPGGAKIYNSVNKLFMMSKYQPVGVMVYGMAEFMGVPWETIIKAYRSALGQRSFPSIPGYASHFLQFLQEEHGLFGEEEQSRYFERTVVNGFSSIRRELDGKVKAALGRPGGLLDGRVKPLASRVVAEKWARLRQAAPLECFRGLRKSVLARQHKEQIAKAQQEVFQGLPLSVGTQRKLRDIAADLFLSSKFDGPTSGVVIAGFGEKEHFPSLVSNIVDGLLDGKLRFLKGPEHSISIRNTASIVPFAQSEMVHTFMEGIDPYYQRILDRYLEEVFRQYPEDVVNLVITGSKKSKQAVKGKLQASCAKLLDELKAKTRDYRQANHVSPVMDAVALLPKDELAAMAESLVNLTSFKRRISMEAETVGGPIDVAVISKGDGFIWIRRKHYFDSRLNPGFLANYYQAGPLSTKEEEQSNA
jgi:hypothetical protein